MANKLYEETNISAIAAAIRSKNGSQDTYTIAEMADAIEEIETGGILVTKSISENGTYNALLDDDADGYSQVTVNVPSGGGGAKNILGGTTMPTSSQGSNGDIYIRYLPVGVKNTVYGQCINTGYSANTNSKFVCDFLVTEAQTSEYPTIFGARPNAGNTTSAISWHMSKGPRNYSGAFVTWQNETAIDGIGATGLLGKVAHVEFENGLYKLTAPGIDVEQILTEVAIASSTPIYLFQMGINGSPSSFGATKGIMIFGFKIYENDVLIHNFVPAKDTNDVVCLYDEVAQEYKYPNSGALEYVEEGMINTVYLKVDGSWILIEDGNWDDVNTESQCQQ